MERLLSVLLLPVTVTGALLGVAYAALTGRHPSPGLLMAFGFGGILLLVAAVLAVTKYGG